MKTALFALLVLAGPAATQVAIADRDLLRTIDAIRADGCRGHPGLKSGLRRDPRLDGVAQSLAAGRKLRSAMRDSDYRATRSAMLNVSGSDADVARWLAGQGCEEIADAEFREIGIAERGNEAWIVLAAPQVPPAAGEAGAVSARILALVNEARSRSRRCGWRRLDAAPPLALSGTLHQAALAHARDMAGRSDLDHTGGDGSTAGERAARAGYKWRLVGENIAAGQSTPEQVVEAWLRSAEHCANLMRADFTEMGVAWAARPESRQGIYWVQLFATPRP